MFISKIVIENCNFSKIKMFLRVNGENEETAGVFYLDTISPLTISQSIFFVRIKKIKIIQYLTVKFNFKEQ